MPNFEELVTLIREQEVGRGARLLTPFGSRLLFYADLTATGRFVHFLEEWLSQVRLYQKGIGDAQVDRLIWFRFVHGSL